MRSGCITFKRCSITAALVLGFAATGSCTGLWDPQVGEDTNSTFATAYQTGGNEYFSWTNYAWGDVSVSFGTRSVTVNVDGAAEAGILVTEGPGGGDTAISKLYAHGGRTWLWTGAPGDSPSTTVTLSSSASGTIDLRGQEDEGGDGFFTSDATAYAVANLGCAPNSHSSAGYAEAYRSDFDTPTLVSTNTSLYNESITSDYYPGPPITETDWSAHADFTITVDATYETKSGEDYITAYASIDCYAQAGVYATSGYPTTGLVWGKCTALSTCTGSASASF